VPYGYSGTALPHYGGADGFTPPVRVYETQTSDLGDQNYTWTPVIHFRGTDTFSLVTDFGNVPEYHIFDYVNEGNLLASFFGTHFSATVPATSGTDYGTLATSFFGTHSAATVFSDAGTDSGTAAVALFGTYTQTVQSADGGTNSGTFAANIFGVATQTIVVANAGTNYFGSISTTIFGTYQLA
jgi:hypothetical protein